MLSERPFEILFLATVDRRYNHVGESNPLCCLSSGENFASEKGARGKYCVISCDRHTFFFSLSCLQPKGAMESNKYTSRETKIEQVEYLKFQTLNLKKLES